METRLDIKTLPAGSEQKILLSGRLDADGAGYLNDFLADVVREGSFRVILNVKDVAYISSAGIRVLISNYKQLKKIGGHFSLEEPSAAVTDVLSMAGLAAMLTETVSEAELPEKRNESTVVAGSYRFSSESRKTGAMKISCHGNPGLTASSGFTAGDSTRLRFPGSRYALGIGALGGGYEDCRDRYGEFMALGDVIIYRPSDGSRVPDYSMKQKNLEPEINALSALEAEGQFSHRILFEPEAGQHGIALGELLDRFAIISKLGRYVFLMVAESSGLVGTSLNVSPVGGKNIFSFPEVRETMSFTTEPGYTRMLTLTLGFCDPDPVPGLKPFLRPVRPGSAVQAHVHSAVFPYQALSRNIKEPSEVILNLMEGGVIQDLLHLLYDNREISGLGESTFRQGVVWIGAY